MTTANKNYVPALTGLRGVAAWWVVFYHFSEPLAVAPGWLKSIVGQGYLAVDLFFILSGYVIFLTSHLHSKDLVLKDLWRFWIVRLIRIYPLHFFVMLMFLFSPLALIFFSESKNVGDRYSWDYFFASLLLVHNWGFFPDVKWNIPSWSISTEFAAYLICPLMIWFGISKLMRNRLSLVLGILGASAILGTIFHFDGRSSIGQGIPTLGIIRCILEFWIGLCVGALALMAPKAGYIRGVGASTIAVFCILIVFIFLLASDLNNYWFVPIIFSVLIFVFGFQQDIFSRFLKFRFVHYFGVISYSTYMIHFLVKDWVKFLNASVGFSQFYLYIFACLIGSIFCFHVCENPSRVWLRRKIFGARND